MSTRSPLPTLSRPRLTALATAAVLTLGLAVTASPASAKPYCKSATQVEKSWKHSDSRRYTTQVCIESREGVIAVDTMANFEAADRRFMGATEYESAGVNLVFYDNGRVVATKRCDVTKRFNDANGWSPRRGSNEKYYSTRTCPDVIRVPARAGHTYQVRATLRLDYRSDDKGAFSLKSVYSNAIRR